MGTLEVMVHGVIDGMEKVGAEMRSKALTAKDAGASEAQAYAEGVAITAEHAAKQLRFALAVSTLSDPEAEVG